MAYTSILAVHRLDRSVEYVMDKDKTSRTGAGSAASSLEEAVDDARDREKQNAAYSRAPSAVHWIRHIGICGPTRNGGAKWTACRLSSGAELCRGGELTPELAHRIGLELAERLLHGQYPAVVATHLNTHCLHNHIVWDSVAMDTGRKYAAAPEPTIPGCALSRTGCASNMGCR